MGEARARSAVAAIVAEAEEAFDDGWSTHPQDVDEPADARRRFRTMYLGAGVVDTGIVATLAPFMDEESAVAGGELTWVAGPLRKGAGLCHGTAGNGYAFLALLDRTGDERWLERARAFAMHAIGQVDAARAASGRGRHTLWTGDLGTALYLADCVDGGGRPPLP